ncbi:MAG: Rieske (2Fe-2S) protein [bacterium]|nr:Rieske (2Fe-2S) protein [bacterium]
MSRQREGHQTPGIPNGWFAVAWSRDLAIGEVKRVRYFDEELVLFRTRSGKARVLDAYCAHLGAHLGEGGRVVGDNVRCPFHAWQFDGETGAATVIPYAKNIPTKACQRPWQVDEKNLMIFVWHHAEDKQPSWQVPTISQFEDPEWCEPRYFDLEVPVHMQALAENNCDPVHFQFVHGMASPPPTEVDYSEDGHFFRATSDVEHTGRDGSIVKTKLVRDTWGLGTSAVYVDGIPGIGMYMFSSTSPVDENNTITRWVLSTTRNFVDIGGEDLMDGFTKGVLDDMQIWSNMIFRNRPVFSDADAALAAFRRWTQQFYSPR